MIVTTTFNLTVSADPSTTVPQWFEDMPYRQWYTPLGTNRIQDVVPSPPYASNYTTDDITGAGNGAGVDQVAKRMVIAYTGGHSGWWGSDAYDLILMEDTAPRWVRIVDMITSHRADIAALTANATGTSMYEEWRMLQAVDRGFGASGNSTWIGPDGLPYDRFMWPTTLVDGVSTGARIDDWKPWTKPDVDDILDRPRPGHTCWSIHYANGKMWYPITQGSNNGSGRGSRVPHSVDITFLREYLATNGTRYQQTFGDKVPCKYYPAIDSGASVSTFGASAIDDATGRIWFHGVNDTRFFSMETSSGLEGTPRFYTAPFMAKQRFQIPPTAICPDAGRRMWVTVCSIDANYTNTGYVENVPIDEIIVYDLDALEVVSPAPVMATAVTKVLVTGLGALPWNRLRIEGEGRKGTGMIWHQPSLAFLLFNCDESPRDATANTSTLFKLHPPLDSNGAWVRGGTWSVSTVTVTGIPAVQSTDSKGIQGSSFSRFNQIKDMGNGESLLISQANVLYPPSFMRLSGAL